MQRRHNIPLETVFYDYKNTHKVVFSSPAFAKLEVFCNLADYTFWVFAEWNMWFLFRCSCQLWRYEINKNKSRRPNKQDHWSSLMNIIGLHGNTRYESKTPWYVVNNKENIGLSIHYKSFIWLSFELFVWLRGIDFGCKCINWYQCIDSLIMYNE